MAEPVTGAIREPGALAPALESALAAALAGAGLAGAVVQGLTRLSGGASQQTWAFELLVGGRSRPLILRRSPPGAAERNSGGAGLAAEAQLIACAAHAGLPVPEVVCVLQAHHGLGDGLTMQRLPGETLGRRIAAAPRPVLARQCGEALARIHALPLADLPPLRRTQPRAVNGCQEALFSGCEGATFWRIYRDLDDPSRCVERFIVTSWAAYLHQRARATVADQGIEAQLRAMVLPGESVVMQHYIAER